MDKRYWGEKLLQGWKKLWHTPCPICGATRLQGQVLCEDCLATLPTPPSFPIDPNFTLLYAFYYEPPIRKLIIDIKFGQSLADLKLLGQLVAERLVPKVLDKPDIILPVPLHAQRLRSRGFNQALELAKPLGNALHCPVSTQFIKRIKATEAQSHLRATERIINVQQAFALAQPMPYKHVALFDDVITTGATLGTIKQLLQAQGVERVDFYACARPLI